MNQEVDFLNTEKKELTPIEKQALAQGWKPKDEWTGEPDEWRSAKEFVERGEMMTRINTLAHDLKQANKVLSALKQHHATVKEAAVKEAIDRLKKQKVELIKNGGDDAAEKIVEIDEKLIEIKTAKTDEPDPEPPKGDPTVVAWVEKNPWFKVQNPDSLTIYANKIAAEFNEDNPGSTAAQMLAHVDAEMRKRFPDKFGIKETKVVDEKPEEEEEEVDEKPVSRKPNAVETNKGNNKPAPRGAKLKVSDLDPMQRKIMDDLVRSGTLTQEQYLLDLGKALGVE